MSFEVVNHRWSIGRECTRPRTGSDRPWNIILIFRDFFWWTREMERDFARTSCCGWVERGWMHGVGRSELMDAWIVNLQVIMIAFFCFSECWMKMYGGERVWTCRDEPCWWEGFGNGAKPYKVVWEGRASPRKAIDDRAIVTFSLSLSLCYSPPNAHLLTQLKYPPSFFFFNVFLLPSLSLSPDATPPRSLYLPFN